MRIVLNSFQQSVAQTMDLKELGQKIKQRRLFLKMTQPDLSELSSVGLRNLKELESGRGNPTLETLTKILEVLGLKIDLTIR